MAYWVLKIVLSPFLFILFRVKITNGRSVPKRGQVILAANHQSFCDSFFLPLCVARKVTYLAKAEYFDDAKTAWFFRAAGQIPIRRGGGDASRRALDTAHEVLSKGSIIGLYPEGTRAIDDYVHKGRTGVARLALESGAPVIPVGLVGTVEAQPVGARMLRPLHKVTVNFGTPLRITPEDVQAAGSEHAALRAFTDQLMAAISELSGRPYLDEYIPKRDASSVSGDGVSSSSPAA